MIPISVIYIEYTTKGGGEGQTEKSVSAIIHQNAEIILLSMISMGFWTILYEWRKPTFYPIGLLLMGIYGVILTPETNIIHYVFGSMVVGGILSYMFYMTQWIKMDILILLQCLEILTIMGCIIDMDRDIFLWEVGFIGIFGIFYLIVAYIFIELDLESVEI